MAYEYIEPEYIRGPTVDDITVEIKGCNFENAVKIMCNQPSKYELHSVLMFREVIAPVEIDFERYGYRLNEEARKKGMIEQPVNYECLQEIKTGAYYNERILLSNKENATLLEERILNEESIENTQDDWELCITMMEDLFKNANDGRAYLRDLETAPEESGCLLENIDSYISNTRNPNVEKMPGINTSMHYIGESGSYTVLHEEDGGLSSLNILKCGSPKIIIYLFIDYHWQAELEKNFADYLNSQTSSKPVCDQILKHKLYLTTPKLLRKWKIPYSIVVQRPGDMFFIRTGVYHAVVNTGRNLAEAINFGCKKWNSSYQPKTCNCDESNKSDVEQNKCIITVHKSTKRKVFQCGKDECEELFLTKHKLELHRQMVHKEVYKCSVCLQEFTRAFNLKRHKQTHLSNDRIKNKCDICKKMVRRLQEHKSIVHQKTEECSSCKKMYSKAGLRKHKKNCQTEFMCRMCSKLCSSTSGLARHMKVHANK